MGRVRLKELMDFHKQAQKTFEAAMKAWEKEVKEFESKYEDADGDHLISQREEIESLLDRGHTFGIVGLYTFLDQPRLPVPMRLLRACVYCRFPLIH